MLRITDRFMQYCRENAKWKERTHGLVERVGIERLRAVLIEDSEALVEALDAAMQRSVDAAYDPWREAGATRTAKQFASMLVAEGAE